MKIMSLNFNHFKTKFRGLNSSLYKTRYLLAKYCVSTYSFDSYFTSVAITTGMISESSMQHLKHALTCILFRILCMECLSSSPNIELEDEMMFIAKSETRGKRKSFVMYFRKLWKILSKQIETLVQRNIV